MCVGIIDILSDLSARGSLYPKGNGLKGLWFMVILSAKMVVYKNVEFIVSRELFDCAHLV